jgi:fructoselysine-6-P-deglycase FrlB-like protein
MYYLKTLCNFNTVQVFDGAEFNSYDIPKIGTTAFVLLSQSGETNDLHRCIEIANNNNTGEINKVFMIKFIKKKLITIFNKNSI